MLNGRLALNNFLKVRRMSEMVSNSTVHFSPTILLHICLHSIELVSHFKIVKQLLFEYYAHNNTNLKIFDLPFNTGDMETLAD